MEPIPPSLDIGSVAVHAPCPSIPSRLQAKHLTMAIDQARRRARLGDGLVLIEKPLDFLAQAIQIFQRCFGHDGKELRVFG